MAIAFTLLLGCTQKQSAKDFQSPVALEPPTIPLNILQGYTSNQYTDAPVVSMIADSGDTIKTGTPIPAIAKMIHPDSAQKPVVIKAKQLKSVFTNTNVSDVALNVATININDANRIKSESTDGSTPSAQDPSIKSYAAVVSTADTTAAFVSYTHPHQTPAYAPRIKDAASFNIQYLDVDQGLNSSYIMCALEDQRGSIWFGTWGGGVSRYNGKFFHHFTEKEGLTSNFIRCILEDKNGNLWFGTNGGGITQFDGNQFRHFTTEQGLIHSTVYCMIQDHEGYIWIGTGGGISRFDGVKFTNYSAPDGTSTLDIRCILKDKHEKLWFGTAGGSVLRLDGNSISSYRYNDLLNDRDIYRLFEDTKGNIWFAGVKGGITQFDGQSFRHYALKEGFSDKVVKSATEDKNGHIWFATDGDGVIRFDGSFFTKYTEVQGLSNNKVFSLLEDMSGNIWCGTYGGGVAIIGRTNFQHFTEKEGLNNRKVRYIYEDKSGGTWFATEGGGVSRYDGHSFQHLTKEEGLADNNVRCILEDKNGKMWFGTFGHGVSCYDGNTFVQYTKKEGLSDDYILSMIEDKKGNLWFGTVYGGTTCYDGKVFSHYTTQEGLSNNTIWTILEDHSGKLWFGTYGGGVSCLEDNTFTHYTEKEGLSNNIVRCILEDKNGNLWFGTEGGGISLFNGSSFTYFTEKEGLSNNIIWNIQQDKKHNLWIGTEKGLNLLHNDLNQLEIITFENTDGLLAKDFGNNSALIDSRNRAWWGTGKSLAMLDLNTFTIPSSPPVINLSQVDINEQSYDFRSSQDSTNDEIDFVQVSPFINIPLALKLPFDKNHLHFQFNAIDWAAPHKLKYTYQLKGLSEDWSHPTQEAFADYRNLPPGSYTLNIAAIGIAQKWSAPVSYTFTIRPPWWQTWWAYTLYSFFFLAALRIFSKWRERHLRKENETLEANVIKRTNELSKALDHLKSTQNQLVLSAKMASLGELTAGIAHEIQNPLNFVNNFSEVNKELLLEMKTELGKGNTDVVQTLASDIIDNEEKINQHGKRADAIVKGMLQHSRTSSGVKEPTDINALADEYLRLAYHGLRAKDKTFNATMKTDFDTTIGKVDVIPQDIGRVILNLITNAFYAVSNMPPLPPKGDENFAPTVTIKTRKILPPLGGQGAERRSGVEISVSDNGPGIPAHILDKIFQPFFTTKPTGQGTGLGLSISYDIVKAHGGELKVETKEGEGSVFTIQLPVS